MYISGKKFILLIVRRTVDQVYLKYTGKKLNGLRCKKLLIKINLHFIISATIMIDVSSDVVCLSVS